MKKVRLSLTTIVELELGDDDAVKDFDQLKLAFEADPSDEDAVQNLIEFFDGIDQGEYSNIKVEELPST